jgi:hypothetical protein
MAFDEPLVPGPRESERLFTAWMTASDGQDHAITDEEFAAHRPEPEAVCGAVVRLAAMETPPGPRCPRCAAYVGARQSMRDMSQRLGAHRHRRRSWLDRILNPGPDGLVSQDSAHPTGVDA